MDYYIESNILVTAAIAPVAVGIYRYRGLDKGSKIFLSISVLSLVTESLAYFMAVYFHNNMVVYNTASIITLFLTCLYFNYTIKGFVKRNVGIIIGIISIVIGIVNNFFIQSIYGIATNFLLIQAFVTIGISITSVFAFLHPDDTRQSKKEVHFWFPVILIFCNCFTYLTFTLIAYFSENVKSMAPLLLPELFAVSVLTYIAIATVFFLYPKLHTNV